MSEHDIRTVADLKPDPGNPRRITAEVRAKLARSMEEFGDLSGVIRNIVTDELVGGHERVERFRRDDPPVEIVERFNPPTAKGTIAVGFVIWDDERWAYREVAWERPKQIAANIAANNPELQGEFEFTKLADNVTALEGYGYDATLSGFDGRGLEKLMTWTPDSGTPDEFPEFGHDIPTDYRCPSCGYAWSGQPAPAAGADGVPEEAEA